MSYDDQLAVNIATGAMFNSSRSMAGPDSVHALVKAGFVKCITVQHSADARDFTYINVSSAVLNIDGELVRPGGKVYDWAYAPVPEQ